MSGRVAMGIDLGTTNCCVGVFKGGRVQIIINEIGSRLTPSYVAYTDTEVLVGSAAIEQAGVNAENTVFEVKRLIGRKFNDVTVQDDIKQWPFKVVDHNGAPKIKVQHGTEEKIVAPEQIAARLLQKMKEITESVLGEEVHDAVITVPAYFNDSQRQATMDAGRIAGLNVLGLLNEPTAAAFAYGFEKSVDGNILVFDWGGGTFDVSILSMEGKNFVVKAVGGDSHLGGSDVVSEMLKKQVQTIERKHKIDIRSNHKALGRLRSACEKAKITVSGAEKTDISIDCLFGSEDFKERLPRMRFEDTCFDLFERTIYHVKNVLRDAQMEKTDIDEVVLVGGSSRIPKVQEMLNQFFNGKKLNCSINPDEAVAYGAAIRAAMFSGESAFQNYTLRDVVPLSLGMEGTGDSMITFIKRNTQIPKTVVQPEWTTSENYQEAVTVKVYEGEDKMASKNNLLGTFDFYHGEQEKAGIPKLTFTFAIDANGILNVSAANEKMNEKKCISITGQKGRLSEKDIKKMKQESHAERESCSESYEVARVREQLESFCLRQKETVRWIRDVRLLSTEDRTSVMGLCDQTIEWIYEKDNLRKSDYIRKELDIRSKLEPLTRKISSTRFSNS